MLMQNKDIAKTALVRRQKGPWLLVLISVAVIVALGFGGYKIFKKVDYTGYKNIKIGSETFKLEIADTEAARTKGLSQRDAIGKNEGMLFDFKKAGDWRIWMVDMHFNIDILWLDEHCKIVHIKQNATPASYPEIYHAYTPNRYVIELPANTIDIIDIKIGDTIKLN